MKLLLDESVPRQLGGFFPDAFEVRTAQWMGWTGSTNGDLLRHAAAHGFDALVTADRGIQYQQNPDHLPIPVLVLIVPRTRVQELRMLVPRVVDIVTGNLQRRFYRITEWEPLMWNHPNDALQSSESLRETIFRCPANPLHTQLRELAEIAAEEANEGEGAFRAGTTRDRG